MDDARLTAREREIAELAAAYLSDDEIAHRLSISRKTVGAHLQTVFRKLGIGSRRQIAARLGIDSLGRRFPMPEDDAPSSSGPASASQFCAPDDGPDPTFSPFVEGVLAGPPRIAGTRLPLILGWTIIGLIALACAAGLGLVVYSSGDLIGRSVYAKNAERKTNDPTNQDAAEATAS